MIKFLSFLSKWSAGRLQICSALVVVIVLLFSACDFNIDDIETRQYELEQRLIMLEKWKDEMNRRVASLLDLAVVVESRDMIVDIEEFQDDKGTGYRLIFLHSEPLSIYHGKNGESVDAPVIGVKKVDGVLYWTQTIGDNTDFVYDAYGDKLAVDEGKDAKAPILGVDSEGFWTMDYGHGQGPMPLLDKNYQPIKAEIGNSLGCLFSNVEVTATHVVFTLIGGGIYTVPLYLQTAAVLGTIVWPADLVEATALSNIYLLKNGAREIGLIALEYNPKISTTERKLVFYPKGAGYKEGKGVVVTTGDSVTFMGDAFTAAGTATNYTAVTAFDNDSIALETAFSASAGTLTWEECVMTDHEGATYNTVKLGGNIWTQRNLNTMKYSDGTDIITGDDTKTKAGCVVYGSNNALDVAKEGHRLKYGLLYTTAATNPLAPLGWKIPSNRDWNSLFYTIDNIEGKDLDDVAYTAYDTPNFNLLPTGKSGFKSLICGKRNGLAFSWITTAGFYCTSTATISGGYYEIRSYPSGPNGVRRNITIGQSASSVRCVREF